MFNKYLKRMYAHEKSLSHFYLGIEKKWRLWFNINMLDFLEIAGTSFSMIQILFLFMNWNHFFVYGLEPFYVDELEPFFCL